MKNKVEVKLQSYKSIMWMVLVLFFAQTGFVVAEPNDLAKKQDPLVITLDAKKVVNTAGKESFSAADKIKPGEVVEYSASYANVSKEELKQVMADLPVPKGMEYMKDSARPASATATVDGKLYEPIPLKRKVKDKTGKEVIVLVPESEYRALRWLLGDIKAGKNVAVSARMQVSK